MRRLLKEVFIAQATAANVQDNSLFIIPFFVSTTESNSDILNKTCTPAQVVYMIHIQEKTRWIGYVYKTDVLETDCINAL